MKVIFVTSPRLLHQLADFRYLFVPDRQTRFESFIASTYYVVMGWSEVRILVWVIGINHDRDIFRLIFVDLWKWIGIYKTNSENLPHL